MRIIAGQKRSMRLQSPEGDVSRPILDRVKESLFSVLYQYDLPMGARVADLFAGVGSLGLEALSRGAVWATFAERDAAIQRILRQNIKRADFVDQSTVQTSSAYEAGALPVLGIERYDLVFVDPPYPTTRAVGPDSQLAGLFKRLPAQVTDQALIVVRTEKQIKLLDAYGAFKVIDRRVWGKMAITFLQQGSEAIDD
ncbi:RsmD family RNA methyltransferase [Planctomycetota bacterium]